MSADTAQIVCALLVVVNVIAGVTLRLWISAIAASMAFGALVYLAGS